MLNPPLPAVMFLTTVGVELLQGTKAPLHQGLLVAQCRHCAKKGV